MKNVVETWSCKQWTYRRYDDGTVEAANLAPDGVTRLFYALETGQYGQPLLRQEPDLGFAPPVQLTYVSAHDQQIPHDPGWRIVGIICQCTGDPSPAHRFSLSSPKRPSLVINDDGSIVVDGTTWHLDTILHQDKNRLIGGVGYYSQLRQPNVRVIEIADMCLVR